jgi:hypothetical protein
MAIGVISESRDLREMRRITAKDITLSIICVDGKIDFAGDGPVGPYRISDRKDGAKILFYDLDKIVKSKRIEKLFLHWVHRIRLTESVEVYIDASVYSNGKKPETQYLMHATVLRIIRESLATLCISVCAT